MKLTEFIEVTGITRIVFDKETVYTLQGKDEKCEGFWERIKSPRKTDMGMIPHQDMTKNLKGVCKSCRYNVRIAAVVSHAKLDEFGGNTINVTTLPNKIRKKETINSFEENTLVIIECPRHGD